MPMWRCPHCGTPQAETSRCWVCKRSSTSCGTCRHFRRSVAAALGYCGLDRHRRPLRGDEMRACWEAAPIAVPPDEELPARPPAFVAGRAAGRPVAGSVGPDHAVRAISRGFVPVETVDARRTRGKPGNAAPEAPPAPEVPPAPPAPEPQAELLPPLPPASRLSLWDELEPG